MFSYTSNGIHSQVPSLYPNMNTSHQFMIGQANDQLAFGTPNTPLVRHQVSHNSFAAQSPYSPVIAQTPLPILTKKVSGNSWREEMYQLLGLDALQSERFFKSIDMPKMGEDGSSRDFTITRHFEVPLGKTDSVDIDVLSPDDIKILAMAHAFRPSQPFSNEQLKLIIEKSEIATTSLVVESFRNTGIRTLGVSLATTESDEVSFSPDFKHKILTDSGPVMFTMPALMSSPFVCSDIKNFRFTSVQSEDKEYFTDEYLASVFVMRDDEKIVVRKDSVAADRIIANATKYDLGKNYVEAKEKIIDINARNVLINKLKEEYAHPTYRKNRGVKLKIKNASNERDSNEKLAAVGTLIDSVLDLTITVQGKLIPMPVYD